MIYVKAGTIITHCIGWLLFLLLPLLFINGQNDNVSIVNIITSPNYWLPEKYFFYALFLIAFLALIFVVSPDSKKRTGVGLSNTKQRLDYLCKEKYELHTDQAGGYYTVRLRIGN